MDNQIDHTTGLLTLREGFVPTRWCTEMVHQDDHWLPLFNILDHWNGGLRWNRIELDAGFSIPACPALEFDPAAQRRAAVFPAPS